MTLLALAEGVGRLEPDGTVSILDTGRPDLPALLATASGAELARLDGGAASVARRLPLDDVRPASLRARGTTVWGIGLNYTSKLVATGRTAPEHPTFFVKAGLDGEVLRLPVLAPDCVDYEGEIAVVIGRPLHRCDPAEAAAGVVALAAADDVTARDVMRSTGNPLLAKSFPGFVQLGTAVAPCADVDALDDVALVTLVNGEVRQHDTSAGMLLSIGEVLAALSQYVVLQPGDLVLTGTPAGTGDEDGRYLAAGDVVEVRVASLPALVTTVHDVAAVDDRPTVGRTRG
jgi:2-keto-4-pentenoate hydratase/2-oxohepta-3-ene-1,7-dioic acid hydratase in catechol pathway